MKRPIKSLFTLQDVSIPYEDLNSVWKCDKRYGADTLRHFIALNKRAFDFIGIRAEIDTSLGKISLRLSTSRYAGTIPLLSPKSGKPYGDLVIRGRFGEDISGLLAAVQDSLPPEYDPSLPPIEDSTLEPPFYFECCRFIDHWRGVERSQWCKFEVIDRDRNTPASGTRWEVYAESSFAPENTLKYPTRESRLSKHHLEFRQLVSVLLLAISEVQRIQTPSAVRAKYLREMTRLRSLYDGMPRPNMCSLFAERASDPIVIREAKRLANVILRNKRTQGRAWRIDYAILFERYVQYLFGIIASRRGYSVMCNPHYSISGWAPVWVPRYLEPDIVVDKGDGQVIVDAKYKSHMLNWGSMSEGLKETFRSDLHQILAYSSFDPKPRKRVMLAYPSMAFSSQRLQISTPLASASTEVYLLGIPLDTNAMDETLSQLGTLIEV